MVDHTDKIIQLVQKKGPVLPAHISKDIGTDIIIASAHLSELVSRNKLVISSSKIGGSPLYYLKGQELRLEEMVRPYLNEKDISALDMLKQDLVLADKELEPLTRVALRSLKDFAVPIYVTHDNEKELFWRWKESPNEDINVKIASILQRRNPLEEQTMQDNTGPTPETSSQPEEKIIQEIAAKTEPLISKPEVKQKKSKIKATQSEIQKEISVEPKTPIKETKPDNFLNILQEYFKQKDIAINESLIIKKNSEIDLILTIPSAVGRLNYYCKAKNKKSVSDSDLNSAFVQGQIKKLPSMILSFGEPNKKAKELLKTELFKGLVVEKL